MSSMFRWGCAVAAVCGGVAGGPSPAIARPKASKPPAAKASKPPASKALPTKPKDGKRTSARAVTARRAAVSWCAPETEALSDHLCYVDGRKSPDARRTLVVFLHGAIAENTDWQWTQERALVRQAKASGFQAIFPRSPLGKGGYVWPGSPASVEEKESAIVEEWAAARRALEEREGKPFDEVFVMGFSSGAYYVSSLALRGRLDVDGYAVFAGGGSRRGTVVDGKRRVPVFVGVCAKDRQTASHSRAFAGALAAGGFPHRKDEQPIGHMFGDVHVARAVAYLRSVKRARTP